MKGRFCDILFASIIAVVVLPLMVVVGVIILISRGLPVFYSEKRLGLRGQEFTMYKFRTFFGAGPDVHASDNLWSRINKNSLPKECKDRLSRVLRKYSIDELPQLWNILMGHMSLVGPRPMPAQELHYRFGPDSSKILSVRPGLTGLWQVSGRNDLSREDRRVIDLHYVENKTPWLDLRIILSTFLAVWSGRGAY